MPNAKLVEVAIDKIAAHPDNPRVVVREDVVAAIVANLDGHYPQQHAVHLRPTGDGYQLLSGHQRTEAAKRKGLKKLWAWVQDVDDATAFMELVTSNNQGELSPLEIGIHAMKAVPKAEGGRGKKGGLSEYAERIGRTKQYVAQLVDAAEVLTVAKPSTQVVGFLDKAKHLCAIHKLPRACWQPACEWLASNEASVADVEWRVGQAIEYDHKNGVTDEWKEYLPKHACMAAVFGGTDPNNFTKLAALAEKVANDLGHDDLVTQWRDWLVTNVGGDSWLIRKVQDKRIELEGLAWERTNKPEQTTVNLILADPPWQYDFAETDNRKIENQYPSASVEEICAHINAPWAPQAADDCVLFLWATAPKLRDALLVMESWGFEYKTHAVWDKEKIGMGYWFRGQHELLLVGTRGEFAPPEQAARVSSVFREVRSGHSKKPDCVYQALDTMFPDTVKAELYQRKARDGWKGYGNES